MRRITMLALTVYLVVQTGLALETRFLTTCYQYDEAIHCSRPVGEAK